MIIYKTTNLINGKIYIGKDKHNNPKYLGSGKLLHYALKKYGKENFIKEIIEVCESLELLNISETYWIKKLKSQDRNIGYNIADGGAGGDTFTNHPNKEKYRISLIENGKAGKGRIFTEEHKSKLRGPKTEKHKAKISERMNINNHNIGTVWIFKNDETIKIKNDQLNIYIQNGWAKGRIYKNIKKVNFAWVYKENDTKRIELKELETYLNNDWRRGRKLN